MHNLDTEIKVAIDKVVEERLVKSSKKIRRKLPKAISGNRYFTLTYREGPVFIYLLLDRKIENSVKHRLASNQAPIPGFITTNPDIPAGVRLQNSQLMLFTNASFKNIFAFSVGDNVSAQLTNTQIDLLEVTGVGDKYNVDLCFVVSPEKGKLIFNPIEQVSDLLVRFASEIIAENVTAQDKAL